MNSWRRIKNISYLVVTFIVIFSSFCYGFDAEHPNYKWALSFSVEQNLTLDPHEGHGISLSRLLSETSSIRVSEYISYSRYNDDYILTTTTSVVLLKTIDPERRAHFYWGVGPLVNTYYNNSLHTFEQIGAEITTKYWQIGLYGILGVEVKTTDYLRLHAEYRASASYLKRYHSNSSSESYNINAGDNVVLGLGIYF